MSRAAAAAIKSKRATRDGLSPPSSSPSVSRASVGSRRARRPLVPPPPLLDDAVTSGLDRLDLVPALSRPDLVAAPVLATLQQLPGAAEVLVAAIDPDLADTAAMTQAYGIPLSASANCVVVAGRRGGEERVAACVVLATTRADVNGVVKRALDVRKASFLATADAVERTGMEYGGITPIGVPSGWTLLVDAAVVEQDQVVVGSGLRRSKIVTPGSLLGRLPSATIVQGLAVLSGH